MDSGSGCGVKSSRIGGGWGGFRRNLPQFVIADYSQQPLSTKNGFVFRFCNGNLLHATFGLPPDSLDFPSECLSDAGGADGWSGLPGVG